LFPLLLPLPGAFEWAYEKVLRLRPERSARWDRELPPEHSLDPDRFSSRSPQLGMAPRPGRRESRPSAVNARICSADHAERSRSGSLQDSEHPSRNGTLPGATYTWRTRRARNCPKAVVAPLPKQDSHQSSYIQKGGAKIPRLALFEPLKFAILLDQRDISRSHPDPEIDNSAAMFPFCLPKQENGTGNRRVFDQSV
jgi:hypothetical protein